MKRFTETNKWRDAWFRKLSAAAKLAWIYLTENCDQIGMVEIDLTLLSGDCGLKITQAHLVELSTRLQHVGEERFFIPKFIHFQYGELSEKCPPHRTIMRMISMHNLKRDGMLYHYPNGKVIAAPPTVTATSNPSVETDSPDGAIEVVTPPPPPEPNAIEIYDSYPKKVARKDALDAIGKAMKKTKPSELLRLTLQYAVAVAGSDPQFIPYPATWYNGERYNDDQRTWKPTASSNGNHKTQSSVVGGRF